MRKEGTLSLCLLYRIWTCNLRADEAPVPKGWLNIVHWGVYQSAGFTAILFFLIIDRLYWV